MSDRRRPKARPPPPSTPAPARYGLRLYVTGMTPRSIRALSNLRLFCERHLPGRCDLEVIDIYQQPELARTEQIVAAPTLVKYSPAPARRIIGDLSNADALREGLGLPSIDLPGAGASSRGRE